VVLLAKLQQNWQMMVKINPQAKYFVWDLCKEIILKLGINKK
jgi:hypothetical protein